MVFSKFLKNWANNKLIISKTIKVMKHVIYGIIAILLCAAIGIVGYKTFQLEEQHAADIHELTQDECVSVVHSGLIENVTDAVILQEHICNEAHVDSVLIHMPPQIVADVAGVLLKKQDVLIKQEIVEEYIKNQSIYDGIYENHNKQSPPDTTETKKTESDTIVQLKALEQ